MEAIAMFAQEQGGEAQGERLLNTTCTSPCASAYALVRADRCARDRNLAYALNARGRVGSSRA